jgi:serine protease Do
VKVVLEIKNGEYFINGKPLDKYDDHNIEVEKRNADQDVEIIRSYGNSPYRSYSYRDDQQDMARGQRDMQKRMQKSIRIKMNTAFLGVSSKKSEKGGATVLEITQGSPAEKAGLLKGDIITKVNDSSVSSPEDLFEIIHNYKPGDKVKIFYTRDGKPQSTSATLEKSQQMPRDFNYNYDFKMPPMPMIMPDMDGFRDGMWGQKQPKIGIKAQDNEDGKGVNIIEVEDSSVAAKSGLKKGDVITQFDGTDVNSTNELVDQMQEARKKSTIKVKILRNGVAQDIDVKIPRKLKTAEL